MRRRRGAGPGEAALLLALVVLRRFWHLLALVLTGSLFAYAGLAFAA
jgi:hypothetical protein